jgi:MoaA/NifB/PqqE/SkfB family radical SAM enzyme
MKLISTYTESHRRLKDEWFLPSLQDNYELSIFHCVTQGPGNYMEAGWSEAVSFKSQVIIETIKENWGGVFVYADVDIEFFKPTENILRKSIEDKDIVCQLDDPSGTLSTGFFVLRANDLTLKLWEDVRKAVATERRDQHAFNRLVRRMDGLRASYLPSRFFGTGTFHPILRQAGARFLIPNSPIMFHANWTIGVENKIDLLRRAKSIVGHGPVAIATNNAICYLRHGLGGPHSARAAYRQGLLPPADWSVLKRPRRVALDVSTACQLKCPSCPTASGAVGKSLGTGFLKFENFKTFLDDHAWVSHIELSNWGEIFLNPDLPQILAYAYRRHVALSIDNGANLNHTSAEVLDALVKYRLRSLSCSIDGASQDTYAVYRVRGNFDRVIDNVKTINRLKRAYRSPYPTLKWQFVAFGHNQHEIGKARAMAKELDMTFYCKLSWDDLYGNAFSPVTDRELIRKETGLGVADRGEYEERHGTNYIGAACRQLWLSPQINFDGRLLGCSINHWGDYGNAFDTGLAACLTSEKLAYAKAMLMGEKRARPDVPCTHCKVYRSMLKHDSWVRPEEVTPQYVEGRRMNLLRNRLKNRGLISACEKLYAAWKKAV